MLSGHSKSAYASGWNESNSKYVQCVYLRSLPVCKIALNYGRKSIMRLHELISVHTCVHNKQQQSQSRAG